MNALSDSLSKTDLVDIRENAKVLTIGHSTLALERFLGLLERAGVTAVADVRSAPFSGRSPHFNRGEIRASLKKIGIRYVFLGNELGGRPRAKNLYCDGVADYEKMALEPVFLKGIARIVEGSNEHKIALMCSEHNPLDCHRCLLVGRALAERGVTLGHLTSDGIIISQCEFEDTLLALSAPENKDMDDMFATRQELLTIAYRSRAKAVAYREPAHELLAPNASDWSDHVS